MSHEIHAAGSPSGDRPADRGIGRAAARALLALALGGLAPTAGTASAEDLRARTDLELARDARAVCEAARSADRLVLLEFAAPWCSDCRTLERLCEETPLAEKLREFERLRVDVGRFDRHLELLLAFDVRAIAQWNVLAPERCDAPLATWPRLASRTLEPRSGARVRTDELADWLATQQARATRRDAQPAD